MHSGNRTRLFFLPGRDALRFTQAGQAMKEAAIRNAGVRRPSQIRDVDTFEDVPLEPSEKEPQ